MCFVRSTCLCAFSSSFRVENPRLHSSQPFCGGDVSSVLFLPNLGFYLCQFVKTLIFNLRFNSCVPCVIPCSLTRFSRVHVAASTSCCLGTVFILYSWYWLVCFPPKCAFDAADCLNPSFYCFFVGILAIFGRSSSFRLWCGSFDFSPLRGLVLKFTELC